MLKTTGRIWTCFGGILLLVGSASNVKSLEFILQNRRAPWTSRGSPRITISSNLTQTIGPLGSLIVYGGSPDPARRFGLNDLWISSDTGRTWLEVNVTLGGQIFPSGPSSIGCEDLITHWNYAILPPTKLNQYSLWTSLNLTYWKHQMSPGLDPLASRQAGSCIVDSRSQIYYFFGLNSSTLTTVKPESFSDVWKSQKDGQDWVLQSKNALPPRYESFVNIHLNNRFLNGRDILYVLGGRYFDATPAKFNLTISQILSDLWVSSDGGITWIQIQTLMPWDTVNQSSLLVGGTYMTPSGVYLASLVSAAKDSSALWASFDGGIMWSVCKSGLEYGPRQLMGLTQSSTGQLYVVGGLNSSSLTTARSSMLNDVWLSDLSLNNLPAIAAACNATINAEGPGLRSWPSLEASSSGSTEWGSSSSSSSKVYYSSSGSTESETSGHFSLVILIVPIVAGVLLISLILCVLCYIRSRRLGSLNLRVHRYNLFNELADNHSEIQVLGLKK